MVGVDGKGTICDLALACNLSKRGARNQSGEVAFLQVAELDIAAIDLWNQAHPHKTTVQCLCEISRVQSGIHDLEERQEARVDGTLGRAERGRQFKLVRFRVVLQALDFLEVADKRLNQCVRAGHHS